MQNWRNDSSSTKPMSPPKFCNRPDGCFHIRGGLKIYCLLVKTNLVWAEMEDPMATFKPVTINKRGTPCQLVFYTPAGERRRIWAGKDERRAHKLAAKFEDWLVDGKDPERKWRR